MLRASSDMSWALRPPYRAFLVTRPDYAGAFRTV